MSSLSGKVAVITGGAGAIGHSLGKLLLSRGASVLFADMDESSLARQVDELGDDRAAYIAVNVTSPSDNQAMIDYARETFGGVDMFFANAGIEGRAATLPDLEVAEMEKVLAVNVIGVALGLKAAVPAMEKRGGGSIVITSSGAAVKAAPGIGIYCASKAAVNGLMRSAALECAPMNIRVNSILPAPVDSPMMERIQEDLAPGEGEELGKSLRRDLPFQRYASIDEIVSVMAFLGSDDAGFVSGAEYRVDGAESA